MKKALLIIDMLNDFILEGAPLEVPATKKIIRNIQEEIDKFKAGGESVIYVCDSHVPDDREFAEYGWPAHAVRGTKGAQVVDGLKPTEGDILVEKTTYSGFYNTSLDDILKKEGINELYLTGCVTNICVLFTASDARLRGYDVSVIKSCVAGLSDADDEFAYRQMENVLKVKII